MADTPDQPPPDPSRVRTDPESLRKAHARYMGMLDQAGLPFEPEELDDATASGDPPADEDAETPEGES